MISSLIVNDVLNHDKAFEALRHFIDEVEVQLGAGTLPDHPGVIGEVISHSHSITSYRANTKDRGEALFFTGSAIIYWRVLPNQ